MGDSITSISRFYVGGHSVARMASVSKTARGGAQCTHAVCATSNPLAEGSTDASFHERVSPCEFTSDCSRW